MSERRISDERLDALRHELTERLAERITERDDANRELAEFQRGSANAVKVVGLMLDEARCQRDAAIAERDKIAAERDELDAALIDAEAVKWYFEDVNGDVNGLAAEFARIRQEQHEATKALGEERLRAHGHDHCANMIAVLTLADTEPK